MKKFYVMTIVFLLSLTQVWAQTKTVSGKVVNAKDGSPVVGATINVNGRSIGATSSTGEFSVKVTPSTTKLSISSIGYADIDVSVGDGPLNISMEAGESKTVTEVIVTGYRSAQKKSFAGSAGTIKGSEIAAVPIASFDQALQGRTPGLILKANSGQPGASGSAIIRGRGSINGSTEPIYIVDGIQIAAADFAQLNPNDIENVSVLKDAVATSLYGSRGGNGVIVVSTKRGTNGKARLEIDA